MLQAVRRIAQRPLWRRTACQCWNSNRRTAVLPALCGDTEERLSGWLTDRGMENNGARVDWSPLSGRGLFAAKDFMKGDVILKLPMDSTVMVYPHDREHEISIPDKNLPDTVIRLAAKLLRDVKTEHQFLPYFQSLPTDLPNPSSVLSHLPHNAICREAMVKIVQYYEQTVSFLNQLNLPNVSEEEIRWALAVIQSRAFGNGMGQEILVPFVDFMNHGDFHTNELFPEHPLANVTYGWLPSSADSTDPAQWKMVIQAKKTILEGEELFVSYGDHSNEFFLLYYGFVPLYNPRDEFVLFENLEAVLEWFYERFPTERRPLSPDQLQKLKQQIAIEGDMAEVVKLNLCADGAISPILMEFLKFLCGGSMSEALQKVTQICQEHLEAAPSILEDLYRIQAAAPASEPFYGYFYASMRTDVTQWVLQTGRDASWAMEPVSRDSAVPVYRSVAWWCLLHEALKKRILWELLLE